MGLKHGERVDGRYRVEKPLGQGAMGMIFQALDEDLERTVALKLLTGVSDGAREDLRREAAALASLRHDHVASVYTFGDHGGQPFFAMEFVRGHSLENLIRNHYVEHQTLVPLHRGVQLLRELCDGLAAVHGAGIVHRDVKPDNVIVEDHTGRAVLVDFGAAVLPASWSGGITGTPHYMAPEAFVGDRPSARGDIYSLGCLAFELLTGELPYEAPSIAELGTKHRTAPIPIASDRRPELSGLDDLFERMLAKNPEARPGSAAAIANQLEDAFRPIAVGASPTSEVVSIPSAGLRILVVDDDPVFARVAARCAQVALADSYLSVSRAATGAAALASATRTRPDVIILDYLLPDTNGVDLLSRLRSQQGGSHAEVLVASGMLGVKDRWRFDILGVRDFVDKPVDFAQLAELIHRLAARRGWIRAAAEAT